MQLLISDANILIDLEEGQLIERMFELPYQFAIPDILFIEELEDEHQHLLGFGLQLRELDGEAMMHAMALIPRYGKASRNDCFALALAARENCPLLTGDRALRIAAETELVTVHGTIWLVGALVRLQVIHAEEARRSYSLMRSNGRRLPWDIAEAALRELESE